VTRVLFAVGTMTVIAGVLRLALDPSGLEWAAIVVGVALIALATRGPWDGEASGRNRSVLGFRVRPRLDE